ncbi:oxygen-independent coproporphyrinogen-3 oxidase [Rhizobium mongolense]|uniref:Oxygen-independent coproporphyrinogen-3 oxidase n=1 Tax=Rhizobium mongolense TaxID=57676 RepID=A0ABR6IXP4_9HYPH|nr:oxygen-independent coproporphyrinogen-3 oxidase [Rhizobium mongolense]
MVQAAINRNQTFEQTETAVQQLRKGRHRQHQLRPDLWLAVSVSIPCRLPSGCAPYGYAHLPDFKKHQHLIDEATLPNAEERNLQAKALAEALVDSGYVRIGLDHFALPAD